MFLSMLPLILETLNNNPQAMETLANSGFFMVDFVNQHSSMSRYMREAGVREDDRQFTGVTDRIHLDDLPTFQSLWRRLWAGQENEMHCEYRLRMDGGKWIWLSTNCIIISRQEDGTPALMIGLDNDISGRKMHETNLQDELVFYKSRLAKLENLREAEQLVALDQDFRKLDEVLLSARKVLHYNLLRVFRLTDGEFELLGSDTRSDVVGEADALQAGMAVHDTRLAQSTLAVPIPRIVDIEAGETPFRSWMGIPLLQNERPFAIVEMFHNLPHVYRSEHIWTAKAWADHLGRTILNGTRYREIQAAAFRDPLSGLYNRRYIEHLLQDETRFRRPGRMSLLMVDLDRFKEVNDEFGHAIGDQVIRKVSELMDTVFRQGDVICRYGGDEFLILLPSTPRERALAVAERFRLQVSTARIPDLEQAVTVSCGVSSLADFTAERYEELFKAADQALYLAKEGGRNQVSWCAAPGPGK